VSSGIAVRVVLCEVRVALWGLVKPTPVMPKVHLDRRTPAPYETMQSTDPQIVLEEPVDFRNHPGPSILRFLKLQTVHLN
jgi:hypothetical protein